MALNGLIAGWLAGLLLGGGGLLRNLVVGLIGSFVGGALVRFGWLKLPEAVIAFTSKVPHGEQILISTIGAIIVVILARVLAAAEQLFARLSLQRNAVPIPSRAIGAVGCACPRSQRKRMRKASMTITRRTLLGMAAGAALLPRGAWAQTFPSQTIRLVVPYPPAGPTDALARIIAQELQTANGWTVIVDNKPGASAALGSREVARAEPDGHTIMLGTNQSHATNAILLKDAGYDPLVDFVPIAGLADLQHALVVRKDLPATSVAELIALAKKDPDKLNYGSTGAGSASHLAMELFKAKTGSADDARRLPRRRADGHGDRRRSHRCSLLDAAVGAGA